MDEPLDTAVTLEAPEHIAFRHQVAGPARRLCAYVIDLVVCYGAVLVVAALLFLALFGVAKMAGAAEAAFGTGVGLLLLVAFAAQWLYSFLWEGLTGRSPGKMLLGLRVVHVSGRPIGLGASALRNVLRAADALPTMFFVGVVTMALNRRFQRLGDLAAGTMVIVTRRVERAASLTLSPAPSPVELAVLPDVVPLDVEERVAIELFLRRRLALGPAREAELAAILVAPLAARFGFRVPDASRTLALLYDRAVNAGRAEGPPSSGRLARSWEPAPPPYERRP